MFNARRVFLAGCLIATLIPAARAQQAHAGWPSKPLTIIVPSAAGGAADFVARTFAAYLASALPAGTVVTVDNRAGAGGLLGTELAKSAPPDGHTLLLSTNSTHAANVSLYRKLRYDPRKDFEPIGMFGTVGAMLMVRSDAPFTSLPQLVAHARSNPGKLNFGYYSSSSQVPAELLQAHAQVQYVGASYRNITQIITDLVGGQLDFAFLDALSATPALHNDRLMAIAVTTPQRLPTLAQVPALGETYAGFEMQGWLGLTAPAGTPRQIVERLNKLMGQALEDHGVRQALEGRGLQPVAMSSERMRAYIAEDIERWARWVTLARMEPQ